MLGLEFVIVKFKKFSNLIIQTKNKNKELKQLKHTKTV